MCVTAHYWRVKKSIGGTMTKICNRQSVWTTECWDVKQTPDMIPEVRLALCVQ